MIAVPKHPRPHQEAVVRKEDKPAKATLKQQLINKIARGDARAANELRALIKQQEEEEKTPPDAPPAKKFSSAEIYSYAIWKDGDQVVDMVVLKPTEEARELYPNG